MPLSNQASFFAALLCIGQASGRAESKALELKWTELAPMIVSHQVELTLRDGGKVSGEAIAVRDDGLLLDVKKFSGPKSFAKGSGTAPRADITHITLRRTRGSWGRSIGTTIGVIAGLGLGGYTAAHADSGGAAVAVLVAVTSGTSVAGYYAGRSLDMRTTRIIIVP